MDDKAIISRIGEFVHEEDDLHVRGEQRRLTEDEQDREQELETALDQCWDLLRQRRARRGAGLGPGDATARRPETVERYLQ